MLHCFALSNAVFNKTRTYIITKADGGSDKEFLVRNGEVKLSYFPVLDIDFNRQQLRYRKKISNFLICKTKHYLLIYVYF